MVLKGAINKSDPYVFDISLVTPTGEEKETIWLPADTLEEDVMDENRTAYRTFERPFQRSSKFEYIVDRICFTKKILRCPVWLA